MNSHNTFRNISYISNHLFFKTIVHSSLGVLLFFLTLSSNAAMMELVPIEDASIVSVQSGKWDDPSTWNKGAVPIEGDRVHIQQGHNVKIRSVLNYSLRTVRIDGTLQFHHKRNTHMTVDTIFVSETGSLVIGKNTDLPVRNDRTARITFKDYNSEGYNRDDPNTMDYDPKMVGLGLITMGAVKMYGAEITPFVSMDGVKAGTQILTLDSAPVNWQAGDKLIIPGTTGDIYSDEIRTISSISGKEIELDSPLQFDHTIVKHSKNGLTLKLHVANNKRNIILETAEEGRASTGNIEVVITAVNGDPLSTKGPVYDNRGHVMMMKSDSVHISNTGFYYLGRTSKMVAVEDSSQDNSFLGRNPRARYSVHFHRAGNSAKPGIINGCMVYDSVGWGYVNHGSNAHITNNVSYNTTGAGFVTERGDELGSFTGNLAIRNLGDTSGSSKSRESVEDWGFQGTGYWLQSVAVIFNNNIASGSSKAGIEFTSRTFDGVDRETEGLNIMPSFDKNLSYNCIEGLASYAFESYQLVQQNGGYGGDIKNRDVKNEITNFVSYGTKVGIDAHYTFNIRYVNAILIASDSVMRTRTFVDKTVRFTSFFNLYQEGFDDTDMTVRRGKDGTYDWDAEEENWIDGVPPYLIKID